VSGVTDVIVGALYERRLRLVESSVCTAAPEPTTIFQGRFAPTPAAVVQRTAVWLSVALAEYAHGIS
jgi:hypothetical protein